MLLRVFFNFFDFKDSLLFKKMVEIVIYLMVIFGLRILFFVLIKGVNLVR